MYVGFNGEFIFRLNLIDQMWYLSHQCKEIFKIKREGIAHQEGGVGGGGRMVHSLYLCGLLVSYLSLCIVCAYHLESLPRYLQLTIPNGTKVPQSDVSPPHFPLAHNLFLPCDPLLLLGRYHS